MLSVSFYSSDGVKNNSVSLSDELYAWLARSDFSKISAAQPVTLELEEEMVSLPLVDLQNSTRNAYIDFLGEVIVAGTKLILEHLENQLMDEVGNDKYRLRKLLDLLDLFKDTSYRYVRYY